MPYDQQSIQGIVRLQLTQDYGMKVRKHELVLQRLPHHVLKESTQPLSDRATKYWKATRTSPLEKHFSRHAYQLVRFLSL